MTVFELKSALRKIGFAVTGVKAVLIERLTQAEGAEPLPEQEEIDLPLGQGQRHAIPPLPMAENVELQQLNDNGGADFYDDPQEGQISNEISVSSNEPLSRRHNNIADQTITSMIVSQLRHECSKRALSTVGNKATLQGRLRTYQASLQ